jgi:hypothetical protein
MHVFSIKHIILANILIFNFSCFLKQLPPFPCRFNFCITPLLQEVQALGLKFIWKKQFSMFFRNDHSLNIVKPNDLKSLGVSKPNGLNRIATIRYAYICQREAHIRVIVSLMLINIVLVRSSYRCFIVIKSCDTNWKISA